MYVRKTRVKDWGSPPTEECNQKKKSLVRVFPATLSSSGFLLEREDRGLGEGSFCVSGMGPPHVPDPNVRTGRGGRGRCRAALDPLVHPRIGTRISDQISPILFTRRPRKTRESGGRITLLGMNSVVEVRDPTPPENPDYASLLTVAGENTRLRRGRCKGRQPPHAIVNVGQGHVTEPEPALS